MPLDAIVFYALAGLIVGSAVAVVLSRNPVRAAIFLIFALVGVGGLYLTLHAEFLFAVQILVYTGGVMVLFLFVIMLVNVEVESRLRAAIRGWYVPIAFTVVTFAALGSYLWASMGHSGRVLPPRLAEGNTAAIGKLLFVDFLLPFEVVSVLLLVAMIGAIVLSKREI